MNRRPFLASLLGVASVTSGCSDFEHPLPPLQGKIAELQIVDTFPEPSRILLSVTPQAIAVADSPLRSNLPRSDERANVTIPDDVNNQLESEFPEVAYMVHLQPIDPHEPLLTETTHGYTSPGLDQTTAEYCTSRRVFNQLFVGDVIEFGRRVLDSRYLMSVRHLLRRGRLIEKTIEDKHGETTRLLTIDHAAERTAHSFTRTYHVEKRQFDQVEHGEALLFSLDLTEGSPKIESFAPNLEGTL